MIRPQYHQRNTSKGKLVWDVRKLVEATADFPIIEVDLGSIAELDETYWFQKGDPAPTCRNIAEHAKLIETASLDFPIILCAKGRVMDGMHRVVKAWCLGERFIKARQFSTTPEPDFVDVSLDDLPYD